MVAVIIGLFAAVAAVAAVLWALRNGRGLLEHRLGGIEDRLERRLGDIDSKVDRRLEGLDGRLLANQQSTGRTAADIAEKLGRVEGATAQMLARANDLARLEQILRPPKARGGFGELLLENLLRDRLPPSAYQTQYGFKSGERVDAVIRVEKLVPIDAKFPLDNFERMVEVQDEADRELFAKAFGRDVKGHIDAIAQKYIRPAEGTFDFAFMYLPVEGIYYELVSGRTGALLKYAHDRRVYPVSPTTLTAYLQVIAFGLKGMEFEQNAHEVMAYLADLRKDFGRFRDDFDVVGKHLGNAQSKYAEAEKRLDRFDGKLERASEHETPDVIEQAELPRAIEAA
ncbi:MAG TPA: DNA recombination protein RmuC [Gaiellaceae bacterium]|nr:DNA recombination protein RmuC [Gaiellaceae bacterium]